MTSNADSVPGPDDRKLTEALSAVRDHRTSPTVRQEAHAVLTGRVAARHPTGRAFRAHHRLPLLVSFAVIPLLGIGMVGAAVGGGLPGPVAAVLGTSPTDDTHQDASGCDDVNPAVRGDPQPGGPVDCTVGSPGNHRQNGTTRTIPAIEPASTAGNDDSDDRGASGAAHTNGKGCDDVNPAVRGEPQPGGPADCTAGNSGDHRQNGKKDATPPTNPPSTAGNDDSDDPNAAGAAHDNGKGCDDVNPAVQGTPTPGGPADCTVGNSGDHRNNGKKGDPSPTVAQDQGPSGTRAPGGSGASADTHDNGKGCDDMNPAVQGTPTRGGPVDCTTGNSGDHRQNGQKGPPGGEQHTTPRKVD